MFTSLLALGLFVSTAFASSDCPAMYKRVGGRCVYISVYAATFVNAKKHCRDLGGKLFEPQTTFENQEVRKALPGATASGFKNFWIGVTDEDRESWFKYTSTRGHLMTSDWKTGFPLSQAASPSVDTNCVVIDTAVTDPESGSWVDKRCSDSNRFVCEVNRNCYVSNKIYVYAHSHTDDIQECIGHCEESADCTFVTWSSVKKICRFSFNSPTGYVSAPAHQQSQFKSKGKSIGLGGMLVHHASSTLSAKKCKAKCQETPECRSFAWYKQATCVLNYDEANLLIDSSVDVVSGLKDC